MSSTHGYATGVRYGTVSVVGRTKQYWVVEDDFGHEYLLKMENWVSDGIPSIGQRVEFFPDHENYEEPYAIQCTCTTIQKPSQIMKSVGDFPLLTFYLMRLQVELGLSDEQIEAFGKFAAKGEYGEDILNHYERVARREGGVQEYTFECFLRDTLKDAGLPVSSSCYDL